MDNVKLAVIAYQKLIEDIAEIQQRIALRKIVCQEFGKDALPLKMIFRTLNRFTLREAPERIEKEDESDRKYLAEKIETVRALEDAFGRIKDQDDAAWSAFWQARGKAARAETKEGKTK